MEITQKFKSKDADGKLVDKEMTLEFRDIDRCRRSDARLFYAAMRMLAEDSKDDAGFSRSAIEGMGFIFIDSLLVKGAGFSEVEFTLLKNDVVAVYQLNSALFVEVVVPFITKNL